MVYSITQNNKTEIVFGKAFTVPSYPTPVIKDIFGNDVVRYVAVDEADNNRNRDSIVNSMGDQIIRNMELGKQILALWREYVIIKSKELGITGQGIEQLEQFYLIECALLGGMLYEASQMVLDIPENVVITSYIKQRFSQACLSADRIV